MAIKKIMPLLLAAVLLFGLFSGPVAFAEKTYQPNEDVNLNHNPEKDSSGSSSSGSNKSSNSGSSKSNENTKPEEEVRWGYYGRSGSITETTTHTDQQTLYYRWYLASGPGTMTAVSSGAQTAGDGYHAGKNITARFSAVGNYLVYSEQWMKDVKVTTTTTYHYDYYTHYLSNDNGGSAEYVKILVKDGTTTTPGDPDIYGLKPQPHSIYITNPDDIIDIPPKNLLQTTANVTFNRQYLYTEKNLDAKTEKPFEVELTFTLSTNSKITNVGKPYHLTSPRHKWQGFCLLSSFSCTLRHKPYNIQALTCFNRLYYLYTRRCIGDSLRH